MEEPVFNGRIELERIRDTRPIRSFIAKRLTGWLREHELPERDEFTYDVTLNKSSYGHLFTCRIRIHSSTSPDGPTWSAAVTKPDLHRAIAAAIEHLRERRIFQGSTPSPRFVLG